jgi:hypothetical protein
MGPDEAIGGLLIAISCGVVLGIAALLIVYKMVDKDLPFWAGLCALIMIGVVLAFALHPSNPVVPGVVLVVALSLMVFFPYAVRTLEIFELRAIDADRLERTFEAVRVRPDNFAAKFELAKLLHDHGFIPQAINLANGTLASLSEETDDVRNRSLKDVFINEQRLVKRWQGEPQDMQALKCPNCGAFNRAAEVFCTKCSRPYALDIVRGQEVKSKVWGKLVLAWAAIAVFIPVAVGIGMSFDGILRIVSFVGGFALVGGLIAWLFKPPKHAPAIFS